jgi:hypothetical protein
MCLSPDRFTTLKLIDRAEAYQAAYERRSVTFPVFIGLATFEARPKDILDPDRYWSEELVKANSDRLFGCAFDTLDNSRSGDMNANINGLIGGHAYAVLRAVEHKGKKFVVVRNPWGNSEWTGRWSDGSKEWTPDWLDALPALGHVFGHDGEFVMECKSLQCLYRFLPSAERKFSR